MGNSYSVNKKDLKLSKSLPNTPALKRWLDLIFIYLIHALCVFVNHVKFCCRSVPVTHTSIPVPATALVQRRCAPDKVRPLPPTPNQCKLHTHSNMFFGYLCL